MGRDHLERGDVPVVPALQIADFRCIAQPGRPIRVTQTTTPIITVLE